MSTTHFLHARLEAFEDRHRKVIKDSMPVETNQEHFQKEATSMERREMLKNIGINLIIVLCFLGFREQLGLSPIQASLSALGSVAIFSLAYYPLIVRPKREKLRRDFLELNLKAYDKIHEVRRYDWCSRQLMSKARRIGLLLDYFLLYALIIDN